MSLSISPESRGAAGLGPAPSPWQGAPGPRDRKPAGQAQWNEPAVLSQRPGPQGGGCWAHSSTSSSHDEPRKPAGQTQRKEPGRFSHTPRPQRPGLCVHSSTSTWSKAYSGVSGVSHPPHHATFCRSFILTLVGSWNSASWVPMNWATFVFHKSAPLPTNSHLHPFSICFSILHDPGPFCFATLGLSIRSRSPHVALGSCSMSPVSKLSFVPIARLLQPHRYLPLTPSFFLSPPSPSPWQLAPCGAAWYPAGHTHRKLPGVFSQRPRSHGGGTRRHSSTSVSRIQRLELGQTLSP